MLKHFLRLMGAVCLLLASPVQAARYYQITGSSVPSYDGYDAYVADSIAANPTGYVTPQITLDPGNYKFELVTSPNVSVYADVDEYIDWSVGYNANDGTGWKFCFWCGEDAQFLNSIPQTSPGVYSGEFAILSPQRIVYGNVWNMVFNDGTIPPGARVRLEYDFDEWSTNFQMNSSTPFTYTFTISPVPEPETWGLMVLGFGLVGFALRRKSRQDLLKVAAIHYAPQV